MSICKIYNILAEIAQMILDYKQMAKIYLIFEFAIRSLGKKQNIDN